MDLTKDFLLAGDIPLTLLATNHSLERAASRLEFTSNELFVVEIAEVLSAPAFSMLDEIVPIGDSVALHITGGDVLKNLLVWLEYTLDEIIISSALCPGDRKWVSTDCGDYCCATRS